MLFDITQSRMKDAYFLLPAKFLLFSGYIVVQWNCPLCILLKIPFVYKVMLEVLLYRICLRTERDE